MHNSLLRKDGCEHNKPWLSFSEFIILMLLISMHTYSLGVIELYGLSIAPWDWAVLLLASLWFMSVSSSGRVFRINSTLKPALILATLFTVWIGVCVFNSQDPNRAITMLLLQIRNLLLFFIVGTVFSNKIQFESLNRKILLGGCIIATVAILMYIRAWFNYSEIVSSAALWKPGIAYNLDQGGALRLIGFAGDPNFYSLWIALPFFISFVQNLSLKNSIISAILGLSLAMAMSRGFIAAFLITTVILLLGILRTRVRSTEYIRHLLTGVSIVTIITVALPFLIGYDLSQFANRIRLVTDTPRWSTWGHLIGDMGEVWNPIIGMGLRGIEIALGGEYSHNSYIDVLLETGLVGFFIWGLLIAYVTLNALKKLKQPELQPWIHTWLCLLVMYGAFSLVYTPFPWLMAAVLTASDTKTFNDCMCLAQSQEL